MKRYTKADLEELVAFQFENLNAMNDLLRIMQIQNQLLITANQRLSDEIVEFVDHSLNKKRKKKK